MKIRITQQGYETFSGLLGDVLFDNGTSVAHVSEQQAAYIAAMFISEQLEDEAPAEPTAPVAPTQEPDAEDAK